MNAKEILKEGKKIMKQRGSEYGDAKEMFGLISRYWSIYLNRIITLEDVSMLMALMKIARTSEDKKIDTYIDMVTYGAFAGEFAEEQRTREEDFDEAMEMLFGKD